MSFLSKVQGLYRIADDQNQKKLAVESEKQQPNKEPKMPDLPEEQVKEAIRSLEAIEKVIDTLLSESEQLSVENIRRELLDIRWSASRLPKKAGKHYYDKKIEKLINSTMDLDSALQHLRYELEETMQAAGNDAMRFKTGDVEAYRGM